MTKIIHEHIQTANVNRNFITFRTHFYDQCLISQWPNHAMTCPPVFLKSCPNLWPLLHHDGDCTFQWDCLVWRKWPLSAPWDEARTADSLAHLCQTPPCGCARSCCVRSWLLQARPYLLPWSFLRGAWASCGLLACFLVDAGPCSVLSHVTGCCLVSEPKCWLQRAPGCQGDAPETMIRGQSLEWQ